MQERRPNKTIPAGEGETPAIHRIRTAGPRLSEVGADVTLPSPSQQLASRVTELEAALEWVVSLGSSKTAGADL